jgi:integrase
MSDRPQIRVGRLGDRWVVSWWGADGKRRRHRLDAETLKAAEAEAVDIWRRETSAPASDSVAEIWAAYCADRIGRRVAAAMASEWRRIGPHFGALRPDQITAETCRGYTALRRRAGIQDGTIWTELGHLRTALRWAAKTGMIARAPEVERPSKPPPVDRYLTRPQIAQLIDAPMAPHIRLAILLMLSTAARPTAALELTWDRVDFERGQIDLRLDATGLRKGRAVVAMNPGLRAALIDARQMALTGHVIEHAGHAPLKSIKTGFNLAKAAARLDWLTPHQLRHTAAVHMAEAGIAMSVISQFLGHTSTSVTERVYARYSPTYLQGAAAAVDFWSIHAVPAAKR